MGELTKSLVGKRIEADCPRSSLQVVAVLGSEYGKATTRGEITRTDSGVVVGSGREIVRRLLVTTSGSAQQEGSPLEGMMTMLISLWRWRDARLLSSPLRRLPTFHRSTLPVLFSRLTASDLDESYR